MRVLVRVVIAGAAAVGLAAGLMMTSPIATTAGQAPRYTPVTDARLRDPEPRNWLMYRGTYNGWGFSPLDQINAQNVADLKPVWLFPTGVETHRHEAPPIVNDGTMFVTTGAQVIALDARTGRLLWRYVRDLPNDLRYVHFTNRGVGLYEDKVYIGTLDAHVVALDATSGTVVWERVVEDYQRGHYITMAPLVVDGKVMVGTSGGERGIRGFVTAIDARTGDEVWKTYTIPAPNEPGNDTWPGNSWETGGAPVWLTGTYDPTLGVTYWGTGNPSPWMGDARPGHNLYSNSTIALDVETGARRGHHQYHWNGSWDWDEATAPLLIDVERGGRTIPTLVHAGRNGYLWLLERHADRISFIDGQPFVYQNVFASLDPRSGRPVYNQAHVPGIGKRALFCPSFDGAKNWPPEAYNPETRLLYVPANDYVCTSMEGREVEYMPGGLYIGAQWSRVTREGGDHVGELQAWNLDTGDRVWTHEFMYGNGGSILTTGGDLVFLGGMHDRDFRAFDARSGAALWRVGTNSGTTGVPTSYAVDGVQYIAVQVGAEPSRRGMDPTELPADRLAVPRGGVVWVFALDCQC